LINGETVLVARVPAGEACLQGKRLPKLLSVHEMRARLLRELSHEPTPRDGAVRDAQWLDAGIEIFRTFVLPLILQKLANRR
jgi:hypothetical protein